MSFLRAREMENEILKNYLYLFISTFIDQIQYDSEEYLFFSIKYKSSEI